MRSRLGTEAHHSWMQSNCYDLGMLEAVRGMATGGESVHKREPIYQSSHHTLLRHKTPAQVEALLNCADRHDSVL